MEKENHKSLYIKIWRKLESKRWQDKWDINGNYIKEFLTSSDFKKNLQEMLLSEDLSPTSVLNLCLPILDKLSYPTKNNDWLPYIYQYTLNKSFEEASTILFMNSFTSSCELFLKIYSLILEYEINNGSKSFYCKYPLTFLSDEEINSLESPEEYYKFLRAFEKNSTFEMMRLSQEVLNYNTLEHICGVHYLSMFIARQLKELGISINLGIVSGAAACHDIGKYGCKGAELKRVPYLHYYYTEEWFNRYGLKYIGNIALNHSTWDLELENLSIESLVLIYSDFRVKNKETNKGNQMSIYSLDDSFRVIFNKLDNVDKEKENRYKRVFNKLKDFQNFLISLGIETETGRDKKLKLKKNINFSLLQGLEIIEEYKHLSIKHNINLMYQLRDEHSLGEIVEEARSEKNWKNSREYIRVFEEYSTYLTQNQKKMTMSFLYDNLTHPEDDIRRHSAEILGNLISTFDEDYRKELPKNVIQNKDSSSLSLLKEYMDMLIYPSQKIIQSHRNRIGNSASATVSSLFKNAKPSQIEEYRKIILSYFVQAEGLDRLIYLIQVAPYVPLSPDNEDIKVLFNFLLAMLQKRTISLRLLSMKVAYELIEKLGTDHYFSQSILNFIKSTNVLDKTVPEIYLYYKVGILLKFYNMEDLKELIKIHQREISEIYLSNLKTDTNWVVKNIQIDLLTYYTISFNKGSLLHTAIHLCNLLKVSDMEAVRSGAGISIIKIMPYLSPSERNEVAVELLRAIEIEGQRFTEYIPKFLGKALLFLQPKELNEIIDDLSMKLKSSTPNIKSLLLKSIGFTIEGYSNYQKCFKENEENTDKRLQKLLGIILNGLADYNGQVKQASFTIAGKYIFGNKSLSLEIKEKIFNIMGKKFLTLITDDKNQELLFLNNSAGLNHIYRFISDYTYFIGEIELPIPENIAFFPGTFDPFSISHKEIIKKMKSEGFQVYLALDEFSWSKQTLPTLLRRNILNMSISDEFNVYIYPDSIPINIGNEDDLERLKESFRNSSIYIAVGSDVILNATSYKKEVTDKSIHNFNHIIFERNSGKKVENYSSIIKGDISYLKLPTNFAEISSTKIRSYIDESLDISALIDPLSEQYIYENGFYQRSPQEKSILTKLNIVVEILEDIDQNILSQIEKQVKGNKKKILDSITNTFSKPSGRLLLLKNSDGEILGFSSFYWVRSSRLYSDILDYEVASLVREQSVGRIILIDSFCLLDNSKYKALGQILITEVLAFAISKDYEYAIFSPSIKEFFTPWIIELLERSGFIKLRKDIGGLPILCVNMNSPCVLNLNLEQTLKEPFRSNQKIKDSVYNIRKKLQESLVKLYPGELILSIDMDMLHQQMIRKLCKENNVPTEEIVPRKLGEAMCVPYGDILDRYMIPNTVTKVLHTEKIYAEDVKSFKIGEFPHYLDLKTQVKMIKSFNRKVILADNLLHKGYRIQALDPIFKEENIQIQKLIVGIMSGRGKDLMDVQGREVDSVYFIPRLKIWMNEDSLYPFIGGDAMFRGVYPERNLLPSINLILPYASPVYMRNVEALVIYNLSKTCIESSIELLTVIEEEFHIIHGRNLNLSSLGQVFKVPRSVDRGRNIEYDLSQSPSLYLKNDLENLMRMEDLVNR